MKNSLKYFLPAVAAGLMIAVAGTAYLTVENKIIGSLLFTVALYVIMLNGLYLFTGKVGYLTAQEDKGTYSLILVVTWVGNLAGTVLGALAVSVTRVHQISEKAAAAAEVKLSDNMLSIFVLAFFCGILMHAAVDGYRQEKNPLILFLCISVFILCGFEHCVANMFYFTAAKAWSIKAVGYLLLMTLGNGVGGLVLPMMKLKTNQVLHGAVVK